MPQQVIVVGGGLSGLSAAHSIIQRGGNVLVLDKNVFLGGNSTKATSGINGALTQTQIKKKIPDSWEIYARDTALGAGIKEGTPNPLMEVLCRESAPAIEWLQKYFNLDLSLVSQLGGHSFPRTHRGPEKFPGMTITYALMEKLEQIEKETNGKRGKVICGAKVTKLLYKNNEVVGVEYELEGKIQTAEGPVVLATGGFAADFGKDSILSKVRPDLLSLSTTNGEHCTGDGIKMAEAIGASTVDLEKVQVHPTGLVDPADPNAKVKFLAAEALRGVGALLLNGDGERFVNELGTRDYVSEVMQKNKGPFRLVLNGKAAKEIEWHCKHYVGRGLMKRFDGAGLAKDIGISPSKLEQTFKKYNEACNKGVNGTPDEFGKKYFNNFPFEMNDTFHVAQVCPLLHYCMGGLQISPESAVVDKQGTPIAGLFACGEVAGGIHLKNRLGGSSLTDCVVFGRVAGDSAATYLLGKLMNSTGSPVSTTVSGSSTVEFTIKQQPIETTIQLNPQNNNIQLNVRWNQSGSVESTQSVSVPVAVDNTASTSTSAPAAAAATAAAPAPEKKELKTYTLEDVAKHNKENDIWVVVNGQVLDCTNFLKKHPGGAKAILLYAGKDATEEFNMLHDANVIEKYAAYTIIGTLAGAKSSGHGAESAPAPAAETKPATGNKGSVEYVTGDFLKPNNPLSLDACVLPTPSSTPSRNSGGTADILPAERKKATFEVEKMTNFIDGGEEATSKKRFIRAPLDGIDMSDMHNWDRNKLMAKHIEHFIGVHKKFSKYKPTRQEMAWMSDFYMLKGSLMNHHGLFLMTLTGMASEEQKQWWLQKALRFEITGCYAQTELGHGSNVRGLQTVATYDKTTQEFIVDTPTLTAMKWWPGTLGKVCTHALVYAQLILDGKEYGVHVFMVQVRDENHRPLPGVEVGDLGAKLGDNANDTGFLRLNKVRIPREHMLAGLQSVTADGQYVKSARKTNDKMHYATMMYTRGLMIAMGAGALAKAATIATRYSCVRRQGFEDPSTTAYNAKEVQIIDHQMQRYRVFKQIALVYTLKFTASWMLNKFSELEKGEVGVIQDTSALPEIAATSAGLKALSTIMVADAIEDLRKCCGGNGYLMSAGIAPIAADYVWQTTAEGDFIILMLQTARFLLKSIQGVKKGQKLTGPVEYLNVVAEPGFNLLAKAPAQPTSVQQLQSLPYLSELFRFRALSAVLAVSFEFAERSKKGESFNTAWNALAVEFCGAVKAHCLYFMLVQAINKLNECKEASIKSALEQVFVMFALSNILDDNWAGLLTAKQVQFAKQACFQVMNNIRPNCVALVDSFDLPDNVLNSTIGRYDGNVYEALYESALKSDSNRMDPFEGYNEVLRPHLDLEFLKRGNKSKM